MIKRVVTIIVYCLIMFVFTLPLAAQTDQFQITYGDTVSDGIPGPGAGNIEIVGAQDTYTFDATAGDEAIFDSVIGNNGVFGWRLVAPNGAILVDSFNLDRRLTLPVSGTYTFSVRGFQASTTGVYSFRLLLVPPPQVFSVSIGDTVSNGLPATGAGNLEVPGAVDLYTFSGVAGQGVIFDTLSGSAGLARVILSAPSGAEVFSGFLVDLKGGLPESGTHILRVEGLNITSAGVYSFRLLQVPAPQIFSITVGDTVTVNVPKFGAGNLEVPGSVDIYSFDGLAGQVVIFDALVGNNGQFRTILTAPDGTELFNDFYVDRQVTLPQTGVYSLQVAGSLIANFGTYSFQLLSAPTTGQQFAISIGDTVSDGVPNVGAGNLEVPGAVDIYRFDGLAGQVVIFDTLVGNNGQFRIILTAPDGTELFNDFYVDRQVTLPQTGVYSLQVAGSQITNFGTYSFQIINVPPGAQEFIINIGDTVSDGVPDVGAGNLEVPGSVDIYSFDGLAGQVVIFDALVGNNGQFRIILTAPDGTELFNDFYVDRQVTLPQTGVYSLQVAGSLITNFGIYSFQLLSVPPTAQEFIINIGDTVSDGVPDVGAGNLEVPGAVDIYRFNGLAGQVVIFDALLGNNGQFRVILPAPDGTILLDTFYLDQQISLPQTGIYSLTITGFSVTNFGTYSFSLIEVTNSSPVATDDDLVTDEDIDATIAVLVNDVDVDGDALSVTSVTQPANGTAIINGTEVTYIPNANFNGVDSFTYTVSDGNGGIDTATVNVTINPVNDDPVAIDDIAETNEDVAVIIDVLSNDTDVDGDTLSIESVTQPTTGTVTNNGDDVTYAPNTNFNGTDSFTYTINDNNGGVDTAAVIITVIPVNDSPILTVSTDPITVNEGDNAIRSFTATDVDDDILTVQVQPGNLNDLGGGSYEWSYIADDGLATIPITITVSDGQGGTASGGFNLTALNVAPEAVFANVTGAITVPGAATLSFSNQSDPSQTDTDAGFLYSYDCNNSGIFMLSQSTSASFNCPFSTAGIYTARGRIEDEDGGFTEYFAEVVVEAPFKNTPDANDDLSMTDEDVSFTIDVLSNDTDVDGDILSVVSVTQPANGTVTNNGDDVTYTPNENFNGTDNFTYTVNGENGGVDTASVIVTVIPVNDNPTIDVSTDPIAVSEGDSATRPFMATDVDGDALAVQVQPGNLNDLGNGRYEWSFLTDDGPVTVTVTIVVSDGQGGTTSSTFELTVLNVSPTADFSNTTGTITVPGSVTFAFSGQSDPSQADTNAGFLYSYDCTNSGVFMLSQSSSASFNCPYSTAGIFTARGRIEDKDGGFTDLFAEVVVEAPANSTPDAIDDISQTDEDISITIDVLANDTDIDGDALSVMSVTQPANGTAISNGVNVTYTPNANFNGIDNFTYTVNDGNGGMGTAAVTITVNPVNDVPVGNGDSGITDQGLAVTIDILANDSDIDGDLLMVSSVTQPPNGSVINSGNNVTYIPNDNFTGTDNFAYVVSDPFGGNDSATVIVTVNPISMPNENTVILQVNQSTDDVNEDGTRFESKNQIAWIGNGNSANNNYLGLRFNGVTVPPNAVIDEAYIEVYSSTGSWINVNIEFTAEATGSSQSFGQHNPPSRRLLTGSRVSDRSNVLWTPDSWHSFKDISPVIQEIIGRDDWQSGNSLSVIVRGIGYQWGRKFFTSYDGNPTFAPRLVVSYHLPEIGAIQEQVVPPANEPIASSAIITETQSPTPTELMATTDVPNPTEMPTTEPTLSPTEEPLPTDVSTTEPTLVPTTSPEPTDMPTVEPTPAPTMAPLPTVTISANVVTGAAPLAIQFVSTATDVTDYAWNFGDGVGSSTETNPVYTFTAPGTYLVTLTVNGVGGSVTATMTITVTE